MYLAHCTLCRVDYIGQSTRSMRLRHLGHRSEIRSGADGLGMKSKEREEEESKMHYSIFLKIDSFRSYNKVNFEIVFPACSVSTKIT